MHVAALAFGFGRALALRGHGFREKVPAPDEVKTTPPLGQGLGEG